MGEISSEKQRDGAVKQRASQERGCDIQACISKNNFLIQSCQMAAFQAEVMKEGGEDLILEKMESTNGRESFNKRKAKAIADDKFKSKRIKGEGESEVKTKSSKEVSRNSSMENSKVSEVQKPDYIHVRARRGQATDSHSLAERAGQFLARSENGDEGRLWKEIAEEIHKDADRLFKMIGEAYAILSDTVKRSEYDLEEEIRKAPKESKSNPYERTSDEYGYPYERSSNRRYWRGNWKAYGHSHSQ